MLIEQPSSDGFFLDSPFSNVADERSARCWSGRAKVHESLLRLKRSLARMADSTLDVMWANLGAGKTHTLLHLAYLLQEESRADSRTVCVFVEMPEQIRNFLDLYRRVIAALPLGRVAALIGNCPRGKILDSISRAANVLHHGSANEKELVADWLAGGRPLLKDLRQCSGISQRIEEDLAATDALCSIAHAFSINRVRLVILVDEFQRIGVLKPPARNKVLSCVRSVFSRTPSHFSMLLSIQSMLEQSALEFVPPELRTLLGKKPSISLPEMDEIEAKEFLAGRFGFFRAPDYHGAPTAPFEPNAIDAILRFIHDDAGVALSPREVLQAFAFVYGQAEDLAKGIDAREATDLLRAAYAPEHES
jgi:hypothetical protein